jgi:hypothetical protein
MERLKCACYLCHLRKTRRDYRSGTRFKQVLFELAHFEDSGFRSVGESDGPVKLAAEPLFGQELRGKGNFKWTANTQIDAFYYPFDSYSLDVNPSLIPVPDK